MPRTSSGLILVETFTIDRVTKYKQALTILTNIRLLYKHCQLVVIWKGVEYQQISATSLWLAMECEDPSQEMISQGVAKTNT
jgi:hypothetical protein